MGTILALKNISFSYGNRLVLKKISLLVEEKDFFCIVGPNGVGKSTLFKLIAGVLKNWSGQMEFCGDRVNDRPSKSFLKNVSFVFQSPVSISPFEVMDYVLLGRLAHIPRWKPFTKMDHEISQNALKLTGLAGFEKRVVSELSGGEFQRLQIAQALAKKPKMLLLDEPTSQLDIGHRIEIMDLLCRLNQNEGVTIVMISHDLNIASQYSKNLALMAAGEFYCQGSPSEVLTYQNIELVYQTKVIVEINSATGRPNIFPIPGRYLG